MKPATKEIYGPVASNVIEKFKIKLNKVYHFDYAFGSTHLIVPWTVSRLYDDIFYGYEN